MNDHPGKVYFSHEQVRSNFIKTMLLIGVMMALVIALSLYIGKMLNNINMGLLIGLIVALVVIPLQLFTSTLMIKFMTKGEPLDLNDPSQRRLANMVEGLAIAAGMHRTPDVYIVPSNVPNAFASGMSEKDAFIGVTQGLLNKLDPPELEGVLAHEISHIVHRDIMLSQLVVALVSVLLVLAFVAERIAWIKGSGERRRDNNNGGAAGFIMLIVILSLLLRPIAMLIGSLIQMAISRKREYAADAYAIRLCNNNEGLARALEKISGKTQYSPQEVESLGGNQLKSMYINFPGEGLFSTHPPIDERIRIIRSTY